MMEKHTSTTRKPIHLRQIRCTAYVRDDGLLDVEATLLDTKPFTLRMKERGELAAGEPIHEMRLCLTLDWDLTVKDAVAMVVHSPFRVCGEIADAYRRLVGMQIKPGFHREVKVMLANVSGCTHLTELIGPLATTAMQAQAASDVREKNISKTSLESAGVIPCVSTATW